jgi:hypothetical protein
LLGLKWSEDIGRKRMAQWTPADRAQLDPFNGVPVQTEGYLLHVRQESPESPNCHPAEDFDFHTWLAAAAHRRPGNHERGDRVHPRVRARHRTWTVQAPELLARHKTRVRIGGWTMLIQAPGRGGQEPRHDVGDLPVALSRRSRATGGRSCSR